jgi:hypothetical protein
MTTTAEQAWMDAITQIGCIVCYLGGDRGTPGAVHHLLDGGRRIGHLATICLCDPGHHQNATKGSGKISRHPNRTRFEEAYGTEQHLLIRTMELVRQRFGITVRTAA